MTEDDRTLIDRILIPHRDFEIAMNRTEQCFAYSDAGAAEPVCLAIIGESRTGKSRCAAVLEGHHPRFRTDDGLSVPVLRADVPSKPTVKGLATLLLEKLGATDWDKGTEVARTLRVETLLRECQVRVLVLDEFQHFVDKASHRVQHEVADWLKNLIGRTRVALVVSGLPTLQAVIDQNEQLAGRFMAPVRLRRFDWQVEALRHEWIEVLGAFSEGVCDRFDMPALDEEELALRLYCATGGLIGYLTNTLRQAIWDAVDDDRRVIDLTHLAHANEVAVWSKTALSSLPNPLASGGAFKPTIEQMALTAKIGVRRDAPIDQQTGGALRTGAGRRSRREARTVI